jgi:hypothetical protein
MDSLNDNTKKHTWMSFATISTVVLEATLYDRLLFALSQSVPLRFTEFRVNTKICHSSAAKMNFIEYYTSYYVNYVFTYFYYGANIN